MKMVLAALLALALCAVTMAEPTASVADRVAAAKALAQEGKGADAVAALRQILTDVDSVGLDKLTAQDQLAVGDAYAVLMALAYDAAIHSGKLSKEEEARARQWRREILGLRNAKVVGFGKEIDLAKELVPGKINIVDFSSEYCPPCRALQPLLEGLADRRENDLFLIRVDINRPDVRGIDWNSPTARQFNLQSIPHLRIYGPDGKLQADGDEARTKVMEMIRQAGVM